MQIVIWILQNNISVTFLNHKNFQIYPTTLLTLINIRITDTTTVWVLEKITSIQATMKDWYIYHLKHCQACVHKNTLAALSECFDQYKYST